MKKTLSCIAVSSLIAFSSFAYAAKPGTYAGLGLGWSKQETSANEDLLIPSSHISNSRDILAGRIFAGYNINDYFGVEAGLAKYGDSKYKSSLNANIPGIFPKHIAQNGSLEYKMSALDVVGKGYLPIGEGFNLYGLGGLAIVRAEVNSSSDSKVTTLGITSVSGQSYSKTQTKIRPIFGIGASYDIPQTKLTTNLEFTRIQGYGNVKTSSNAIPSADLVTLNLAYNFG